MTRTPRTPRAHRPLSTPFPVTPLHASLPAALAGVLLLLVACSGGEDSASAEHDTTGARMIPVAVEVMETGTMEARIRAWATVSPEFEADIHAGVSGRVDAVRARLGDRVTRGQTILEIDLAVHRAGLAEAETDVESARIASGKAGKDFERNQALFESKNISDTEFEDARAKTVAAAAVLASAEARLARARRTLDDARVEAPFTGQIAVDPPDAGTTVSAGRLLTRVVNIDRLEVTAGISEKDLARIHLGTPARITVESLPGREFEGVVSAIGPEADAASRQFPVTLLVENPPAQPLKGGMVARVEIVWRTLEDVPLLPIDALVEHEGEMGYFVVSGGVARWREPALGPRNGELVAVESGAGPGDSVVVLGQTRLTDGSRIRVETAP